MIADATSHLIAGVQKSLKSGVNCNNKLHLEFRADVFRFVLVKVGTPQKEEDFFMT